MFEFKMVLRKRTKRKQLSRIKLKLTSMILLREDMGRTVRRSKWEVLNIKQ